jgi:hypothetical protein
MIDLESFLTNQSVERDTVTDIKMVEWQHITVIKSSHSRVSAISYTVDPSHGVARNGNLLFCKSKENVDHVG